MFADAGQRPAKGVASKEVQQRFLGLSINMHHAQQRRKEPETAGGILRPDRFRAAKITVAYAVFAVLWIYFSDQALLLFLGDADLLLKLSIYKGVAFVLITSLLLFGLILRAIRKIEAGYRELQEKEANLRASERRAEEILAHAFSAVITLDHDLKVSGFNLAAEKMFLCSQAEALGRPLQHFIPAGLGRGTEGEAVLRGLRSNGEEFAAETGVCRTISEKQEFLTLFIRDISERLAHEAEIERLRRLYASLSQINHAIVLTKSREDLLVRVCRVLVEQGGFQMAWIGWHQPPDGLLSPVACWGDENDSLRHTQIHSEGCSPELKPSSVAFREERAIIVNDPLSMQADSASGARDDEMERRGFRSSAAFPIREGGHVRGVLSVYGVEKNIFRDREIALLEEVATDIAFALDNLNREAEKAAAEAVAEGERLFSATMIEATPGILYLYDMQGRFLRWNRNFERVSGYQPEEIARMHPLDFFAPQNRHLLEQRIQEVFSKGESSVEAPFLSKDGTSTPYFFTGRRVGFNGSQCLVGVGIDISVRKMAETALRQSERRYRTTLDNILEGCQLVGFDWRYLYLNDAAAAHNRRPKQELLGRTMLEAWPGIDRSPVYQVIQTALVGRTAGQEEVDFVFPDGSRGWFDMRVQPVEEGALILSLERTEQKLAGDRLAASEQKYRELVENANSIILRWNSSGLVTFLNEYGQQFFGYQTEEILGRHVLDTIVPATESGGRDLGRLMEQICADPEAFERNVNENKLRDGRHVWVSWTNRIVRDAQGQVREILSVGTDITAQMRAHEALRHSEEQFRLIMENLADLVAVLDLEGRRLYNSPSYNQILGDPEKLRGSSSFEQIHPEDLERVRAAFAETVRTGVGRRVEYRLLDRHGEPHYIESQGSVIHDSQGKPAQVVVVSRDVTDRKQADMALRMLNETLEQEVLSRTVDLKAALVRAEAADRIKSAFLASMSHELRTPLNSIIGFTGIILQGLAGPLNAEQTKQLNMVRGSARHLLELINDVLDISKIEAGQMEVRSDPFDLAESIDRVAASVQPLADKKSLTLTVNRPAGLVEMVSDRRRIEQVLINLVNNAIKFTEKGGVTLAVEVLHEWASTPGAIPGPAVKFAVRDTGMGIKPENLAILFQPFRQIDTGLSRQHEGTGLGLAICQRLVSLMGGEISVKSVWQHGSEFTVILPVKRSGPL